MIKLTRHVVLVFCLVCSIKTNGQADKLLERAWDIFDSNTDSAAILTKKAFEISKKNGDLKNMGRAISYGAIFYQFKSQLDSSLLLFHKAINLQESIHDSAGLVRTYNNTGIYYYNLRQYSKAEPYYQKAYHLAMQLNNYHEAAGCLVNLGTAESFKEEPNKEFIYLEEAERLYVIEGDSASAAPIWANYAKAFYKKQNYPEALKLILRSVHYNDQMNIPISMITNRILLARILLALGRFDEAEKRGFEALSLSNQYDLVERRQYTYDVIAQIYYEKKDYKTSIKFLNYYVDLRDSLLNNDIAKKQAEMEAKNGIERKNVEITRLKLDVEKNKNIQLQKEQLQTRFYSILIALGIGLLVLIILVISIVLLRKNLHLEKTNSQLLDDKKQHAEDLLEKETMLMRESHHRIKNNLQLINSILDLQSRNIKQPAIKMLFTESIQRIQAISFAHQRLYGTETVEKIDIKGFLEELIQSIQSSSLDNTSNIKISMEIDELIISTEKAIPIGLIINELVTNSIKYAFEGTQQGLITVKLTKKSNELELWISDNGKGMDENPKETGFGTQLVKSMTRQLKAKYSLYLTQGVKHIFIIPLT